jgi:hypothetical protein
MKKYKSIIACAGLVCALVCGCGASDSNESEVPQVTLDAAEITIPSGLVGTEASDDNVVSVDEETGNITFDLTGKERSEIVNNLAVEINDSINKILDDKEYYPDVESITPNEDYTEFTIALIDGQVNIYESMLSMSFYTVGNRYQIYSGVESSDALTTVIYTNASTGEVIAQSDSSSMSVQ